MPLAVSSTFVGLTSRCTIGDGARLCRYASARSTSMHTETLCGERMLCLRQYERRSPAGSSSITITNGVST